jgi:hypothetical protein
MAKVAPKDVQNLVKAIRNLQDAVNREISDHAGIAGGPDLTNIQTALNTFKTALASYGFTIS